MIASKTKILKHLVVLVMLEIFTFTNLSMALDLQLTSSTLAPTLTIKQQQIQQLFSVGLNDVPSQIVTVPNELGVHARPAVVISNIAQQFPENTDIFLEVLDGAGMKVDAKDVFDIMSLAVQEGEEIKVSAQGNDAQMAVDEISAFIEELVFFDGDEDLAFSFKDAQLDSDGEPDTVMFGTKAVNTLRMSWDGIPVPPGFIVVADRDFQPRVLKSYLKANLSKLTENFPKDKDWIVSVRSSPMRSAPGLYDTILNVGINAEVATTLGDKGRGWQLYYEYLKELAVKALDIDAGLFEGILVDNDKSRAVAYSQIIQQEMKKRGEELKGDDEIFPMEFLDQLVYAILAIKKSSQSPEVKMLRQAQGIDEENPPIAVKVQQMVFGNADKNSGSFILSTVDERGKGDGISIEYGQGLQGKAIVDGRIMPQPIEKSGIQARPLLKIKQTVRRLQLLFETPYLQIEGVIEKGEVYILQSRNNSSSQQVFERKDVKLEDNMLKGRTIFAKNLEDVVGGVILKPLDIDDLPIDSKTPYLLAFEYADAKSVRILYDAVFNKGLNISGVVTGVGGTQSHFARQIELLNDLGHDIPYMSAVNYEQLRTDFKVMFNSAEFTLTVIGSDLTFDQVEFDFNFKSNLQEQASQAVLIEQAI